MSGAVQAWRKACGKGQVWNDSHIEKGLAYKPLKVVRCPECQEEQSTKDLKLKAKFGFSNLRCQACQMVRTASSW